MNTAIKTTVATGTALQSFRTLHDTGFILPNAWDAASARLFELAGFPALGTTSAAIAYRRGRPDGQRLSLQAKVFAA